MRLFSILTAMIILGCSPIPQGSGPSPNQILVVSASSYPAQKILESIGTAELGLDEGFDKSNDVIGDSEHPRYPQYEIAYWYPFKGSEFYGVAIVKWVGDSELSRKYYIDVYSEDEKCSLCEGVIGALQAARIVHYSACKEKPRKSEYEAARCET